MFLAAALSVALCAQSRPAEPKALRWGSTPPALSIGQWVTHRPPALPGAQVDGQERIFIIHFWSMRDDRSRAAIPYLAQLHATFADKPVTIIALSNEDPDELTNFCGQPNYTLPYAVAADAENETTNHWLADVAAFPWTFVLDRSGKVIWSGNSLWQLRDVVAGAVDGSYTLAVARKRIDAIKKIEDLNETMDDAMNNGDVKAVRRIADRIIKADPLRLEGYAMKRNLLIRLRGEPEKTTRDLAKLNEKLRAASWDASAGLAELLDWQWSETNLAHRDPHLMLRCAKRLVELTKQKDPFALSMLARVQHELGQNDEAIATQRAAAQLIKWDPEHQFPATLGYYERVKRAASGIEEPAASQPTSQPTNK